MIGIPCQPGRLRPPHPIVPPESARPAIPLQRRLIALAGMLWLALCLATVGACCTPWPEKPQASNQPSVFGLRPRMGLWSGVTL